MDRLPRLLHWLNVVDQQMVSVERVFAYTELAPEPGYSRVTRPPLGWPQEGTIELRHLSLRYTPRAPEVLKNLNFTIAAGEKVGIVGRTGAGKSSLASALLRMPDPQGDVIIDDLPTSDMNIRDYRRAITLIPQSPFLFNDTLRRNIDPTDGYSDAEVRQAMDQVGLGRVLQGRGGLLLSDMVTERGANFSVGERQLICLARALLSKTKIILLDEATANVDLHTDRLIHSVIRREFKYSTVLMIAHRLETVLECDRIMVLHDGEVVEFGKPNDLLQQDGYFRQLLSVEH